MIKLTEKIGYGFGDMASSMFWKLFGAYLMIFYTDVFGLPAAAVGTMFLITRIWDSVFDPIVGVAADRTHLFLDDDGVLRHKRALRILAWSNESIAARP